MNATHGACKQRFLETSEDNVGTAIDKLIWENLLHQQPAPCGLSP